MKLHEEFKLYENMWEAKYCYIVLTGDFPNKYFVHGVVATEQEAKAILNKAVQGFSGDAEMAKMYDLTDSEAARLESMVGKEVTGADADFIADFFTDGSRVDSLYNNFNEAAGKLQEAGSSGIQIVGCDLEETIDHMMKWGRCPKLPWGWIIDNIDDTDSDSQIIFSHRKLPVFISLSCKYYMGSTYDQCKYEFGYYAHMDGTEFDHATETFKMPDPEGFIKRIFEVVTEFDKIWENSDEKTFVKNLKAAGYKKHK